MKFLAIEFIFSSFLAPLATAYWKARLLISWDPDLLLFTLILAIFFLSLKDEFLKALALISFF